MNPKSQNRNPKLPRARKAPESEPIRPALPPTPRPKPAPRWARYSVVVDTTVRLTFRERVILLFTGTLTVRTWNAIEKPPGRIDAASKVYVDL